MFVSKCPLRISLLGGSTDLEDFIQKFGSGKVISFPSNLHVYSSVHYNNRGKYILNYSKNEEVQSVDDIRNHVIRVALKYFDIGPVTISFLSDIISTGSGLASSSAYMISLIKVLSMYKGEHYTEFEICKLALELERKFNPSTGYQDPYGCGIGGFKKMLFTKNQSPSFTYFGTNFLTENFDMALYHTGISRNSTKILESIKLDKNIDLPKKVDIMGSLITSNNPKEFLKMFNNGWKQKKESSKAILCSSILKSFDTTFSNNKKVLGVKLLGAGGGGYFLALCNKGSIPKEINGSRPIPINVSETGVVGFKI